MWKLISLFTLFVLAQAADINDIYGDWWHVAFYPVSSDVPVCRRVRISKGAEEMKCTYADGRNPNLLLTTHLNDEGQPMAHQFGPVMMVNTSAEVMPALNTSIMCDGYEYKDRSVVRLVNEDYFIFYANIPASMEHTRSEIEQNIAILFGKNVVSSEQLSTVISTIEDLKNRRGTLMCTTENYGGSKSTGNEIKN